MADLDDYRVTDYIDDATAEQYNRVLDSVIRGELANIESLSANRTLTDADFALQILNPSAARNVILPAVSGANHPYYICNTSASYALTIKNVAGATIGTVSTESAGSYASDGVRWHSIGGGGSTALTGDVTGSGSGTIATTIATSAVTLAKMANMATGSLLGRSTAGSGAPEVITVGTGLTLSAGTITASGGGASSDGWTAGTGTWSYSSADSPTFVISVNNDQTGIISVGMRIKLTQTTVKYFIVTAVGAYSGGVTLITVYGGTDYTLANAAISSPYISGYKTPLGFPMSPLKWTQSTVNSSFNTQSSPTTSTWYNVGSVSLSVPIGAWILGYNMLAFAEKATTTSITAYGTLSTGASSETDTDYSTGIIAVGASATDFRAFGTIALAKPVLLAAKTTYYVNIKTETASTSRIGNGFGSALSPTIIRAICAYL